MKKKEKAKIISQNKITDDIYDLWIKTDMAKSAHCGQFVGVYTKSADKLLPRPISICEISDDYAAIRLVYRTAGKGTEEISRFKAGDDVYILGVLGNGYEFDKIATVMTAPGNAKELSDTEKLLALMDLNIVLMGGGIGIPPMLETAKELKAHGCEPVSILGYRDSNMFLKDDLTRYGAVYIATEDGSLGTRGNVLDALKANKLNPDIILSCGPMPMLKAIARYSKTETENGHRTEAFLSLEERMACGVGACLGCVTRTKERDAHSNVKNARICTDGPVFLASELEL